MSGPRFVVVSGVLPSGARRQTWPDRAGLVGETGPGASWVAWRLLGRNNHELGRSATVFPSAEHLLEDIDHVRSAADALVVGVLADGAQGEWRWRLQVDGRPVAVSSRTYLRQRECHYSASVFRQTLPDAALPAVRLPGSRTAPAVVDLTRLEARPGTVPPPQTDAAARVGCA